MRIAEDEQATHEDGRDHAAVGGGQKGGLQPHLPGHELVEGQGDQNGGDGHHGRDGRLVGVVSADNAKEAHHNGGVSLHGVGHLVGTSGNDHHLNGPVVLHNVPIITEAQPLSHAGTEVLGDVLAPQADAGQNGHDGREDHNDEPLLTVHSHVGVSGGAVRASVLGHQVVDGQDGEHHAQQGVKHGIEHGEHGALLRVVGHTGLGRLGDAALEGIANDVEHVENDVGGEPGSLGNLRNDPEDQAREDCQNDIAQDQEGPVLTELGAGLVDENADEGVGDAVPHTQQGGDGAGHHYGNADKAGKEVADGHERKQVQVGGSVVQSVKPDLPRFRAVDATFWII